MPAGCRSVTSWQQIGEVRQQAVGHRLGRAGGIDQADAIGLVGGEAAEGLRDLVVEALPARGVVVRSMRNKANRLEELFVRLVESGKEAA